MIMIKDSNQNLLKKDKRSYRNIGICYIGYITTKEIGGYETIHDVKPLHLIIDEVDR